MSSPKRGLPVAFRILGILLPLAALAQDLSCPPAPPGYLDSYWRELCRGRRLARRIRAELGSAFPKVIHFLEGDADSWTGEDREQAYAALLQLLSSTGSAPATLRPVMLFAGDRLAERLRGLQSSPRWDEWKQELAGYGVKYKYLEQEPTGSWVYTLDLLWRVWKEHGRTHWGEQAFVLLEEKGWDTSPDCSGGSDLFREVIARGEKFLAERTQSPFRTEVLFAVAEAYETWWSLSLANAAEEEVAPELYREGADAARLQAIVFYERVLRLAPKSYEAGEARKRLPQLRAKEDTVQRRFYCLTD